MKEELLKIVDAIEADLREAEIYLELDALMALAQERFETGFIYDEQTG